MSRYVKLLCGTLLSLLASMAQGVELITLGITPQHAPNELGKLWVPISQYLSKQTGYRFQFKTSKDLTSFWKDAEAGVYDILYINPYYYTRAQASAGYKVFAKDNGAPLVGILFVRTQGSVQQLQDLHESTLAVPDLSAFVTSKFTLMHLRSQGIQVTPVSVHNNDSVFRAVEIGLHPAGASIQRIFGLLDPATQAQFKIIWRSEPLPPFAYASHPRVSPKVVAALKQALLDMDKNAQGRALLSTLNIKDIVAARDGDFDSMRQLKLE